MSKRSCEYCKYLTSGCRCRLYDRKISTAIWFDRGCQHFEELKQTIFEKITSSMETLAEKLVYHFNLYRNTKDGRVKQRHWSSSLTEDYAFETREEAVAATVEKLKKEWKG